MDGTLLNDFAAEHAGQGFEQLSGDEVLFPRLSIVEKLSRAIDPETTEFVEGAKIGSIVDTTFGIVYGDIIEFIPVTYVRTFVERKDKDEGGTFVAEHNTPNILLTCDRVQGQYVRKSGNIVSPTLTFFGFVLDAYEGSEPLTMATITVSKGRYQSGKMLLSRARQWRVKVGNGKRVNPPIWARTYMLTPISIPSQWGPYYSWKVSIGRDANSYPDIIPEFNLDEFKRDIKELIEFSKSEPFGGLHAPQLESPERNRVEGARKVNDKDIPF